MKRFTATEKWDKEWFRKLTTKLKCFWGYLCDHCDHAGVWEPDYGLASFKIGETITAEDLTAFQSKVQLLPNGKVLVVGFVEFQYGELSKDCRAHTPIFKAIKKHGIDNLFTTLTDGLTKPIDTLKTSEIIGYQITYPDNPDTHKDQDQDQDQDQGLRGAGEKGTHPDARSVLAHLNRVAGRFFRETEFNLSTISARLRESGVETAGVLQMIDRQCAKWGSDPKMSEFLRPETLFGKQKFDSYYACKDLAVQAESKPVVVKRKLGYQP